MDREIDGSAAEIAQLQQRVGALEFELNQYRDFRLAIDTMPALAWSANVDGAADFFNKHYLDYVGLTLQQVSGWQWTRVIHSDDLQRLGSCWESFRASGTGGEVEARVRRYDGVYRWFLFRANPLRDQQGNISKWFGVNTDIEDRKQAETLLAVEKQLLELVASGRALTNVLADLCRAVEAAAPECCCEVQLLAEEGQEVEESVAPSLPEGHRLEVSASKPVVGKTGLIVANLCVYSRPDTSPALPEHLISLATHIAGIAIERLRSEDELRRREFILAAAERITKVGSFAYNMKSKIITFSEEMRRIHEYEDGEDVTRDSLRKRIHPEDLLRFEAIHDRAQGGRGNPAYEVRLLMPDGRVKYVTGMSHMVQHEDGRLECIGANQDVTQRRLAEEQLDKLRSDLAHVARVMSLGTLTASIAHEVNQPLSGIVTNANTCVRMLSAEPPNVSGALETARRTIRDANRASEVVKRLRSLFARDAASSTAVDLNDAALEVLSLMSSDLSRNRVHVKTELASDLPVIAGDRVQLQQVILNLVRNGADAMSSVDHPRQITLRTAMDGEANVLLSVRDRGVGFAEGSAEQMFQPFYTTKDSGMGIGLSVSRSIIESHSGRLWAEAAPDGAGAVFSFAIPIARQ